MLHGFANSMFQASYSTDCGESKWRSAMTNNTVTQSFVKISHWKEWKKDINNMKEEFNVSSYRISIEWSHIEPQCGQFDQTVLNEYKKIVQYCNSLNITPMLTLHHFNEPLWFSELNGFEKEENINYFLRYCKYVFEFLHNDVKLWCTINEPGVYAFMSYFLGGFPPHARSLYRTVHVLKNLMIAHTRLYKSLKCIDESCQLGIAHNVLIFKRLYYLDPLGCIITNLFNPLTNDLVVEYLQTGTFKYNSMIAMIDINYSDESAPISNDFIGLNFYANPIVGPNLSNIYGATCKSNQEMGDMYLALDPEGFSSAIDIVSKLNLPIYITEIGIADHTDIIREKFVDQYMEIIMSKKDIKGVYFWTYRDNYEWNETNKEFGFHTLDGEPKSSCLKLKKYFSPIIEI